MNAVPSGHGAIVARMFERIAARYDRANSILSCGLDVLWRRRLLLAVANSLGGSAARLCILDLAAGTLEVSVSLAARFPHARVLAVDFCLPMLLAGGGKIRRAPLAVSRRVARISADGLRLPLKDASVDAITVAFGLRNMLPRAAALAEAFRVLRPGASLFSLEFGTARRPIWGGLYNFYLAGILPALGGYITGDREAYAYLARTVAEFPSPEELAAEMTAAGFSRVRRQQCAGGVVFLHRAEK